MCGAGCCPQSQTSAPQVTSRHAHEFELKECQRNGVDGRGAFWTESICICSMQGLLSSAFSSLVCHATIRPKTYSSHINLWNNWGAKLVVLLHCFECISDAGLSGTQEGN